MEIRMEIPQKSKNRTTINEIVSFAGKQMKQEIILSE
jgi:hypothetical protein